MSARIPDRQTVLSALELAVQAPSVHNSQPWRWRIGERSLHLYADPDRWLPATDPNERDLVVSCGAALHHARTALAALGWSSQVHRLPNPAEPEHLAAVEFVQREPNDDDLALAAAIPHRRADRRPYTSWEIPESRIAELIYRAAKEGVILRGVTDASVRAGICAAIAEANRRQRANPAYVTELAAWSGRSRGAREGVPASNAPTAASYADLPLRGFDGGGAPIEEIVEVDDGGGAGELLVLGTTSDDRLSRLRGGEATSAVLLAAAKDGLATCPLTQPLETGETHQLVETVLGGTIVPQMIIRIGWPSPTSRAPQRTPRRVLDDVLDPFEQ